MTVLFLSPLEGSLDSVDWHLPGGAAVKLIKSKKETISAQTLGRMVTSQRPRGSLSIHLSSGPSDAAACLDKLGLVVEYTLERCRLVVFRVDGRLELPWPPPLSLPPHSSGHRMVYFELGLPVENGRLCHERNGVFISAR